MSKSFTKIICIFVAAVAALGIAVLSACGGTYKASALKGDYSGEVSSNGGFAVEKGNYIYFINGKQANTADNTFGKPVKGAVMRISKTDFSARNYDAAETVVPHIAYSGQYNAGIYIYGDYVYYATPSTEKNSNGEIQNSYLAFKRTKLDATGTMKDYYIQLSDSATDYRYVEIDGTVYLLYVATNEKLYGESTGCTNIHSVNLTTRANTLLAYNVDGYVFDGADATNGRIYYTMKVKNLTTDSLYSNYNQIYTVTADADKPNEYDFSAVKDYDADKYPMYVNCGKLIFDGIGAIDSITEDVTQFNGITAEEAKEIKHSPYTYALSSYDGVNGMLYYTRISKVVESEGSKALFAVKESDLLSETHNCVKSNPDNSACLITDSAAAGNYTYLYKDGAPESVLIAGDAGFTKAKIIDGKITTEKHPNENYENRFLIPCTGKPTVLFTASHDGVNYIYYSLSSDGGDSINRVGIDGVNSDYNGYKPDETTDEFTSVNILDLDACSDWYKPEMIDGQIIFATETEADYVDDYNYIMVCDLRKEGKVLTNAQISDLNDLYEGITEQIDKIDAEVYENLPNALHYAFLTGDRDYLAKLIKAYTDILGYDEEKFWSVQSVEKYYAFIDAKPDGEWGDYSAAVKVNGKDVAANKRDYYYTFLGAIPKDDNALYTEALRNKYLQSYPVKEGKEWYEPLGVNSELKGAFAVVGIVLAGLIVIAAAVTVPLVIVKKRKKSEPVYRKRYKVDTTDDKNINVYEDENSSVNKDGEAND